MLLIKLHNIWIDEQERSGTNASPQQAITKSLSDIDEFHTTATYPIENDAPLPIDLLDSGHHFTDVPRSARQNCNTDSVDGQIILPRALLHEKVVQSHKSTPSNFS